MENNLLRNFVTIEHFRNERPRLSIMNDEQIQEALNIATTMLDGICNGLISLVIQYSLSKDKKDECDELFRTDFELNQIKNAIVFQTQYVLNLGNDFTIGSNSASTGGINYSFQRPEARQELAPGVKEFLARARVFELTNIGSDYVPQKKQSCNIFKEFLNIEDGDRRYLQKYQPNVNVGSIAVIGDGHTIAWTNPQNTQWDSVNAKKILDIDGDYKEIHNINNIAFFGNDSNQAMTRQEIYNAIWNSMFYNSSVTYPNEAIVRVYDDKTNLVYTFKSNQDNNKGHHPILDNKDGFWWKQVGVADKVDFDELVERVINSRLFIQKLNDVKNEFDNTLDAFWNQIKDNEHLLRKFEELYDQTVIENNQLEQKLDTKIQANTTLINNLDRNNIAYKNQHNNFTNNQTITGDTAFIEFKKGTARKGYIGKAGANSDNIVLHCENGDLVLKASQNVRLEVGARNGVIGERAPTQNNHLTNKKYVDDKIRQEIGNVGGNIDLAPYALKAQDNKFVNQTINDNTPYITFINEGEGETYGRVGNETISNKNLTINALLRDLELKAKGKVICSQTPTEDNDVANKKYVDSKLQGGSVDTTNLAKLNETNIFTELNSFNKLVAFNAGAFMTDATINNTITYATSDYEPVEDNELISKYYLNQRLNELNLDGSNFPKLNQDNTFTGATNTFNRINGDIIVANNFSSRNQPTSANDLTTKAYVDSATQNVAHYGKNFYEKTLTLHKSDIVNGLWGYKIVQSTSFTITDSKAQNKSVTYKLTTLKYGNNVFVGQVNNYVTTTANSSGAFTVNVVGENNWVLSGTDLYSGSAGRFNGKVRFLIEYWY